MFLLCSISNQVLESAAEQRYGFSRLPSQVFGFFAEQGAAKFLSLRFVAAVQGECLPWLYNQHAEPGDQGEHLAETGSGVHLNALGVSVTAGV
ncbi:hypothetical protein [Azospirillum palustre]|uniref:hypothetical protein n=1 Tax=Azospirillum palustre TaxID=2044885 RepID=UPI001177F2AE|nr:hypothetical protein [Azospirillum palustre]